MKIEVSSIFYDALEARYRADIVEWVEKLAAAEDKLAALREHFQQVQPDGSSEQDSSKKGDQ